MNLIESLSAVMGSPPGKNTTGRTTDPSASRTDKAESKKETPSVNTEAYDRREAAPTDPKEGPATETEIRDVERTVRNIQEFLDTNGRELSFQVNRKNGQVVVEVYRKSDGKLIRRIPPEDLQEPQTGPQMSGLLITENA